MKPFVSWAVILAFVAAGVLAANIEVPEDSLNPDNFDPGIAKSDDFLAHKVLFLDVAENLKADFACTRKHFADNAGFARSASTAKRYFTYCGNNDRIDLTIIDETEYYINRNGSARRQYSVKQGGKPTEQEVVIRIAELEAKVRPISSSNYSANLELYRQLLTLDPANMGYIAKVNYYLAMDKAAEQDIGAKVRSETNQTTISECQKEITDWLTHNIAKNAVKKVLKAPRSARFSNYYTVLVTADKKACEYLVTVDVDAQNAFGSMIRQTMKVAVVVNPRSKLGAGAVIE